MGYGLGVTEASGPTFSVPSDGLFRRPQLRRSLSWFASRHAQSLPPREGRTCRTRAFAFDAIFGYDALVTPT
jgi:hypothetical protein